MKEIVPNFSVLKLVTLHNFRVGYLLEKAFELRVLYKKTSALFSNEILRFPSTFRHKIENSSSIGQLVELMIIKNKFISPCFPEVCTAFCFGYVITAGAKRSFLKFKLIKTFYGTREVKQLNN